MSDFKTIIDPKNGKTFSLYSKGGKKVLKQLIHSYNQSKLTGGSELNLPETEETFFDIDKEAYVTGKITRVKGNEIKENDLLLNGVKINKYRQGDEIKSKETKATGIIESPPIWQKTYPFLGIDKPYKFYNKPESGNQNDNTETVTGIITYDWEKFDGNEGRIPQFLIEKKI